MTARVRGPSPVTSAAVEKPAEKPDDKKARELGKAAHEFEAIFVRSMLEGSGALGKKKDGYSDMAVSALASSITEGKGIGLGESIRQAIEHAEASRNHRDGRS